MELTHDFIANELPRRMPDGIQVAVKSTKENGWLYHVAKTKEGDRYLVEFTDGHDEYDLSELELLES